MTKIIYLFILIISIAACSFNKNSKFWTNSERIEINEKDINKYKELYPEEKALKKEFNSNLKFKFSSKDIYTNSTDNNLNNLGIANFNGDLKKSSRYKFSKIRKFNEYQPEISFSKNDIIFFDNKGSILKFDDKSKLLWKKNYYEKNEKKLNPVLQFANNNKYLAVADNIAKYYLLDLITGDLIWIKNNLAPFNSQIKIHKDKIFIIDFANTLRCFSLKNGNELWEIKTEQSLIRSQKKLSMVIHNDIVYFNNSIGDISAVDINKAELLWQLPTQSSLIYESAFELQTSDLVSDGKNLFFSNNKNQFFSIDMRSGNFNWKNKINSHVRPTIIDDYLITISLEGYFIVLEKKTGNIIRVTDVFSNFKEKKRSKIEPTGFVAGLDNIYLTTSNGKLLVINIYTGKTQSILKIDNEKISKPFIKNKEMFLIKDNAIIKLN